MGEEDRAMKITVKQIKSLKNLFIFLNSNFQKDSNSKSCYAQNSSYDFHSRNSSKEKKNPVEVVNIFICSCHCVI